MSSRVPPPVPGQAIEPFIANTLMWRQMLKMLDDYNSGLFTRQPSVSALQGVKLTVKNGTSGTLAKGTLVQLTPDSTVGYPDASDKMYPIFNGNAPTWHSAIDHVLPFGQEIAAGETAVIGYHRYVLAKCTVVSSSHRYAMIDPANPSQLKTADAGIFKLMADVKDGMVAVDVAEGYFNWRFQLTEDWDGVTAQAKLLNWDGSDFDTTATTISDPDGLMGDLENGDTGYCHHIGNQFIAYQAPCDIEAGPVFPTP